MKKLFLLVLSSIIFMCGCDFALEHYDSFLIFSENPITPENFSPKMVQNTFDKEELINYCIYSKEPFRANEGRVQVFKKDPKTQLYGFSLEQSFDICLNPEKNYYQGSFTIFSDGYYLVRVFTKNSPQIPIAQNTLWVNQ